MAKDVQVNREIKALQLRLLGVSNEQLGVMPRENALLLAEREGLDLIMLQPNAEPPVCKICDYGKYKYEQLKKAKEAKKKQVLIETKELKISPNIGKHDLDIKVNQARKFILKGNKVKVTLVCKGREITHLGTYKTILLTFINALSDIAKVDNELKLEGKTLFAILSRL